MLLFKNKNLYNKAIKGIINLKPKKYIEIISTNELGINIEKLAIKLFYFLIKNLTIYKV